MLFLRSFSAQFCVFCLFPVQLTVDWPLPNSEPSFNGSFSFSIQMHVVQGSVQMLPFLSWCHDVSWFCPLSASLLCWCLFKCLFGAYWSVFASIFFLLWLRTLSDLPISAIFVTAFAFLVIFVAIWCFITDHLWFYYSVMYNLCVFWSHFTFFHLFACRCVFYFKN